MYIGEVSKLTGASKKAIHHYEELGLLSEVSRLGKYRIYDKHHVVIISMIKRAQSLGFKLSEMLPMMKVKSKENRFPIEIAIDAIEQKQKQIKIAIEQAKQLDVELGSLKKELIDQFSFDHADN
ncbi:MerR family transcriptional regulator [Aliiglaciecola sp. 2_MG-2023]|uniref:MerR family transcriptional regulator n=1 Tax=unclassified Aliiglaciecola TaxID=2593648 RepID=UPI0026E34FAD|nr:MULTISPECIES: MerR family transcriptional regulator [unclassified Aliiglaciecola]MDO6712775.1 MerR family transcriptional regulator [Aliiglaciecola sp. 2_MG-2023]MDO6753826.1 MerR family transcriptional regulator [Aliiglaciecola sp. 1_MG-2023]